MLGNGKEGSEMDMENSPGLMELSILENGEKIGLTAKVDLFTLMGIFMMVFGRMIKLMDMVFISM